MQPYNLIAKYYRISKKPLFSPNYRDSLAFDPAPSPHERITAHSSPGYASGFVL